MQKQRRMDPGAGERLANQQLDAKVFTVSGMVCPLPKLPRPGAAAWRTATLARCPKPKSSNV